MDVAYPFLLELYDDFANGRLEGTDFEAAVRLVEAYVFRRAVCAIPTNSLNKTFATFAPALQKDRYLESVQAHLLTLPSYRRFPGDEEFKREFVVRDLYNFPRRSYWLRRLENHGRKERVPVDEYTIEHILPQNEKLSAKWRDELGPEWQRVQETWLHTLGNLTLTGYNVEYSDHPFSDKRDMKGGFRGEPIKGQRAPERPRTSGMKLLSRTALNALLRWPRVYGRCLLCRPRVLESYRPRDEKVTGYTLDDHAQLATGSPMRDLFEIVRKDVLALDRCVTEEFLKLYVAYKAETNFVECRATEKSSPSVAQYAVSRAS